LSLYTGEKLRQMNAESRILFSEHGLGENLFLPSCQYRYREGRVPAEDFKATYVRYKKVRKDWINGGSTAGDWTFNGPIVD
jgi:hypothetical protein